MTDPAIYTGTTADIGTMLTDLFEKRRLRDELDRNISELQQAIVTVIDANGMEDTIEVGDERYQVRRTSYRNFNLHKLRQLAPPHLFDAVTQPKIDVAEFDRMVMLGLLDSDIADQVVEEQPRKTYIQHLKARQGKEDS
jgi:hypothetical protein